MVYRENALPPGEMRRRMIDEKKALEELKYQEDLEARWASNGDAEAEGVPGWAKERFLDRKAAEGPREAAGPTPEQRTRVAEADQASLREAREHVEHLDDEEEEKKHQARKP